MADSEQCICNNGHFVFSSLWKEHLYLEVQAHAQDQRFFNNALKSGHIEGKMSAREMQFSRALGQPTSAGPAGGAVA
jgi:hypothetical protein